MNILKFTLVELLIVIAILGLLVSILFPSLAKARERAKEALCQSNQSQLVKTMFTFADKNDMDFPIGGTEHARSSQVILG
ncbi:MAG: type II secretion system GspH family protein [Lentisphaerales bacterium]|nr:type II secretion system GspH family protein [Lentisphaerales bacterium]